MYILRFTFDIERDVSRGWSADGPQISDPFTGDAYPFEGNAEEFAEELGSQNQFSIGHIEFFPNERDDIKVISDDEIMIGSVEVKSFVHKEFGKKYWATVDKRHDGLACYASENLMELKEIANQDCVIPDESDNLASAVKSGTVKNAKQIEQGESYIILKISF
jgi:hypothetical protein